MTFSTVKVSALPDVNLNTVDGKDHFIINDNEGATKTTNKIEVGEFVGYIESLPLVFKNDITFEQDVVVGGEIKPLPGSELTITVDNLNIRQELNLESTVVVTGLELNDLEDVDYDSSSIEEGDTLIWDSTNKVFKEGTVTGDSPVYFTVPTNPKPGDLWWRKDNGKLYIYYESPNGSSHWVQASGDFLVP